MTKRPIDCPQSLSSFRLARLTTFSESQSGDRSNAVQSKRAAPDFCLGMRAACRRFKIFCPAGSAPKRNGTLSSFTTRHCSLRLNSSRKFASYSDRYAILVEKQFRDRLYDGACFLFSSANWAMGHLPVFVEQADYHQRQHRTCRSGAATIAFHFQSESLESQEQYTEPTSVRRRPDMN